MQQTDSRGKMGTGRAARNGRRLSAEKKPSALMRAIRYLGRYKREALMAYAALIIATGAQLMVPQLVQKIIDTITDGVVAKTVLALPPQFQAFAAEQLGVSLSELSLTLSSTEGALIYSGLLIVLFAILRGFFAFAQSYMGERVSQSVAFDLRNELFAKLQRLSFSYHDRARTGNLMIRATDDVEKARMFIGQGLLMAVQSIFLLSAALIILTVTNARLVLVVLPVMPIALALSMVIAGLARPLFIRVQGALSKLNAILQENLAGIKVVKAFGREAGQLERFDRSADAFLEQILKVMRLMTVVMPLVFLVANLGQNAILFWGGQQIIGGSLTLGEWSKFSLYLVFVFIPVGMLGFIISQMSQASASATRIFEILDARSDVAEAPEAIALPQITGRVAFEEVGFRYFSGGEAVLEQINLTAEPGESIALLGMTGSGKSTVINLIPRFYDPTEGRVTIDGHDLRTLKIDSLREQIGIVLQETTLFSGTIRENIAFGKPQASADEVVAAARAAAAHDFIVSFPGGYDTPVGERGMTLSGGQKQRIAIARALLLNPRILILDDSTSSVDLQTEWEIQQALDKLMQGRTSFVIAQRISTVLNADKIVVLDKGRIAASGVHEELLEESEIYAEIYYSQLQEDVTLTGDPDASVFAGQEV